MQESNCNPTLGIAYTKLPSSAEDGDSGVVVVRKTRREVRLLVSWRWMSVCGALGRGNETSTGFAAAVPLMSAVSIAGIRGHSVEEEEGWCL